MDVPQTGICVIRNVRATVAVHREGGSESCRRPGVDHLRASGDPVCVRPRRSVPLRVLEGLVPFVEVADVRSSVSIQRNGV